MEPIRVPGPPKAAFNKQRPMSDLIKAQVRHFKHLEHKLAPESRTAIPQHHIITEDDAARYIAPMSRLLRSESAASAAVTPFPAKPSAQVPPATSQARGLSIAATADPLGTRALQSKKKSGSKSVARKPSPKGTK